ncbi:MAG: tetratricopeptide repeat protein, partial [Pseudomonadales bacterium]|nr:tetratricopeptide repeat protein [Pseudomonadales bacterium]
MAENSGQADNHLAQVRQKISSGEFSAALEDLDTILRQSPQDTEALYMRCVTQRYIGDLHGALATIEQLKTLSPSYSRAHQEEGHVRRALQEWDAALNAYTRALQLNPALEASLRAQL